MAMEQMAGVARMDPEWYWRWLERRQPPLKRCPTKGKVPGPKFVVRRRELPYAVRTGYRPPAPEALHLLKQDGLDGDVVALALWVYYQSWVYERDIAYWGSGGAGAHGNPPPRWPGSCRDHSRLARWRALQYG